MKPWGGLILALMLVFSTYAVALEPPAGKPVLTLSGKISNKNQGNLAVLDAKQLDKLPWVEIKTTNPWYPGESVFRGPLLKDVLALVGATGTQLQIKALNDYATLVPLEDASKYRPILARTLNGKQLLPRDKGPLFLVYPYDSNKALQSELFYGRSAWQIATIEVQ